MLDELDPIEGSYVLDVSSLGAEKPIKVIDLPKQIGKYVNIRLSHPYKGHNVLEGTIEEAGEESVTIAYYEKGKKSKAQVALSDISGARRAVKI